MLWQVRRGLIAGRAALQPGAAVGFQGLGDITSGSTSYHGLRAYNAAYATSLGACLDLVDQAKANLQTFNVKADGTLDVAAIATWKTVNSVTNSYVAKLYDQTGNGKHIETPGVGGTLASMPELILSGFTGTAGTRPIVRVAIGNQLNNQGTALALSTGTIFTAAKRPSGTGLTIVYGGNVDGCLYFNAANTAGLYAQGFLDSAASVTDNQFWSLQGYASGVTNTSKIQYGNTSATGDAGVSGITGPTLASTSFQSSSFDWFEGCIWSGDQTSGANTRNSNAKAYWGY